MKKIQKYQDLNKQIELDACRQGFIYLYFIQSITRERIRFSIELEKARKLQYFAVIVEGSFYDIKNKNYKSLTSPQSILSTLFMWSVKFGVPLFLVDSREGGALAVLKFAEAFLKYKVYEDGNKSDKD